MTELEFSRDAVADIENITAFSIERFGRDVADAYLSGLEIACDRLRAYPELAAVYPRLKPEMRCLVYRRHRVFYRVNGETVLVARVLHHAQDVKWAMK